MRTYIEPAREEWGNIIKRPAMDWVELEPILKEVFESVKTGGDAALKAYTKRFDNVELESVVAQLAPIEELAKLIDDDLRSAIDRAYDNIYTFHKSETAYDEVEPVAVQAGVTCWRAPKPVERVGLYIPGGTAPLISTTLMLGVPAQIAGCVDIQLATPPLADGSLHPAIAYAAAKVGVTSVCLMGGSQAIAAFTFGTESVRPVDKVFGPGNQYVTGAKEYAVRYGVAIDMPAGPSEVLVMADANTNPVYAAADLLSQAEHGIDSQVVLVVDSEQVASAIHTEVERQVELLPRRDIAKGALEHSFVVVLQDTTTAMEFVNTYAPEHLILSTSNAEELAQVVTNAGSVFVGAYTPESAGDYASGTNHTLPTGSWARSYGGVSVDSFRKFVTFQRISNEGINDLGPTIIRLAEAEELEAHANAVRVRIDKK